MEYLIDELEWRPEKAERERERNKYLDNDVLL
jgi:hypothetical protein